MAAPPSIALSIRLAQSDHLRLRQAALSHGTSVSALVRQSLRAQGLPITTAVETGHRSPARAAA